MVCLGNVTDDILTRFVHSTHSQTPNRVISGHTWVEQRVKKEWKIHNASALLSRELKVHAWNFGLLHSSKIITHIFVVARIYYNWVLDVVFQGLHKNLRQVSKTNLKLIYSQSPRLLMVQLLQKAAMKNVRL
jgi:hypothetical protein